MPRIGPGRPRVPPDRVRADKAYASCKTAHLRRRGIRCTIPDNADQARNCQKLRSRGGRPPHFDAVDYHERHAVQWSQPPQEAPRPPGMTNSRSVTRRPSLSQPSTIGGVISTRGRRTFSLPLKAADLHVIDELGWEPPRSPLMSKTFAAP